MGPSEFVGRPGRRHITRRSSRQGFAPEGGFVRSRLPAVPGSVRRTVRRRPRCRSGHSALMRGGRAASAPPALYTVDGIRSRSRTRTGVTGVADRLLTTRTCGSARPRLESNQRPRRSERRALSAELRGRGVGAEGFEPSQQRHLLYRQARLSNVGALPWGGCRGSNPDRESHNLACTAGTPQPPCPNEGSNLGPPVCKTGALPLSYTGLVPTARLERATVDS